MTLINLPNELLDIIILFSMPHEFQKLARTCKKIYTRCAPYIQRHNKLCAQFRCFEYNNRTRPQAHRLLSAFDLISRIAVEPRVSEYIQKANLSWDSEYSSDPQLGVQSPKSIPRIEDGGPVVRLFSESRHLQRAGLDWKEYYSIIVEDVEKNQYSQHACAFLLTLLPNLEDLRMVAVWHANTATNQLLNALSCEAKQSSFASSGLRSLGKLYGDPSDFELEELGLSWAGPFLAQPQVSNFITVLGFSTGTNPNTFVFRDSPYMAEALTIVCFRFCCIDHLGITNFLRNTPQLRTLLYSHRVCKDYHPPTWDICAFVNAISAEAGSHLDTLSVRIETVSLLPGKATLRFQKLRNFDFPPELVLCNMEAMGIKWNMVTSLQHRFNDSVNPFVGDLIPSSVENLVLWMVYGGTNIDKAVDGLFCHFRSTRKVHLRNLKEVYFPRSSPKAAKRICARLAKEAKKEGVRVRFMCRHADPWSFWPSGYDIP